MSVCPKGHASASDDYCDDCGAPMGVGALPMAANACPQCGIGRESGARFCEVCQYDFQLASGGGSASGAKRQVPAQVAPQAEATAIGPAPAAPMLARIHASADLAPDDASRAAFPPNGIADRIFHLDLDENMVGRESASKNSHPEIPLLDPGASRRHLKIARLGGAFHALELGSANGTLLDGAPLEPGLPAPLRDGSVLRVGMWTTISIEAR